MAKHQGFNMERMYRTKICPICKKEFIVPELNVHKVSGVDTCSYGCNTKLRKQKGQL